MIKTLKIISKYLDNVEIENEYDKTNNKIYVPIMKNDKGNIIHEQIMLFNDIIRISISIRLNFDVSENDKCRLSEYLHRANFDMIRGNFEYDIDNNVVRFKHYIERCIIFRKNYTIYNVLVSATMFQRYFKGMLDIFSTDKSPKEINDEIDINTRKKKGKRS